MIRTYNFRLYPNQRQEKFLWDMVHLTRSIYNAALEERIQAYRRHGIKIKYAKQVVDITSLRNDRDDPDYGFYQKVPNSIMTQVPRRLDKSFSAFFRRLRNGERPGFPKFQSSRKPRQSFEAQNGVRIVGDKLLISTKTNRESVKIKLHRQLPDGAKIKMYNIGVDGNKWFVRLQCEIPNIEKPMGDCGPIGMDVGCRDLAALSDGVRYPNPRHMKENEKRLRIAQRKMSRRRRGSNGWKKAREEVQRIHRKVRNSRRDLHHKVSREITSRYDWISMEKLRIDNMMRGNCSAVLADAGMGQLQTLIREKSNEYGIHVAEVNPQYTSQICSECGERTDPGSSKKFRCSHCGHIEDRDINAAKNILKKSFE